MLSNTTTKPGLKLKSYPESCVDENVDEAAELLLERSSAASVKRRTTADGNQFKPPSNRTPQYARRFLPGWLWAPSFSWLRLTVRSRGPSGVPDGGDEVLVVTPLALVLSRHLDAYSKANWCTICFISSWATRGRLESQPTCTSVGTNPVSSGNKAHLLLFLFQSDFLNTSHLKICYHGDNLELRSSLR